MCGIRGMASPLKYIELIRPWSLVFTSLIYAIGVAEGLLMGLRPDLPLTAMGGVGMVLVQSMGNVINDFYDFHLGIDRGRLPRVHALIDNIMSPRSFLALGYSLGAAGLALGLAVTLLGRPLAMAFGAYGLLMAYGYSSPLLRLKYRALGDLAYVSSVLVLPAAALYVAAGSISAAPAAAALPLVLSTEGVMHANNYRDIERDSASGVRTLASIIGRAASRAYYIALITASAAIIPFMVAAGVYPARALLVLPVAAPMAALLAARCERRRLDMLDLRTAEYSYLLGFSLLLALLL